FNSGSFRSASFPGPAVTFSLGQRDRQLMDDRVRGSNLSRQRLQMVLFKISTVVVAPLRPGVGPGSLKLLEGVAQLGFRGRQVGDSHVFSEGPEGAWAVPSFRGRSV